MFKKELLKFITPERNSTYNISDIKGLKLLTQIKFTDHKSDTTFRTVYPQCVIAVRILKQRFTSSFTVPIIIVQGKPYCTR